MTATLPAEYRDLALSSSNEMMAYDSRWVLGRYTEAAWHILQAGQTRLRMGELMHATGNVLQAAADWLSAAECFYRATDLRRMSEALVRVRAMVQAGIIPAERHDLHTALQEREAQISALERRMKQFQQEYARGTGDMGQEALAWLLGQSRDLPGFVNLQAAIVHRATRLGQFSLALQYLDWADRFAPENPDLKSLRVAFLLSKGERDDGLNLGLELLRQYPEMKPVRLLLAVNLAFKPTALKADWEHAVELLRPLNIDHVGDWMDRLAPLALSATLHQGLAHDTEHRRLLDVFNRLAESIDDPAGKIIIAGLRRELPQVFPLREPTQPTPLMNLHRATDRDLSALRQLLAPLIPLSGVAA